MAMLITCNQCKSKSIITNRYTVSDDYHKLYCQCTNKACNHRFSMLLTFDTTQQPPLNIVNKTIIQAAFNTLKQLPKNERQLLLTDLLT